MHIECVHTHAHTCVAHQTIHIHTHTIIYHSSPTASHKQIRGLNFNPFSASDPECDVQPVSLPSCHLCQRIISQCQNDVNLCKVYTNYPRVMHTGSVFTHFAALKCARQNKKENAAGGLLYSDVQRYVWVCVCKYTTSH